MKKKLKLAFAQLEKEIETISNLDGKNYNGGSSPGSTIMQSDCYFQCLAFVGSQFGSSGSAAYYSSGFDSYTCNSYIDPNNPNTYYSYDYAQSHPWLNLVPASSGGVNIAVAESFTDQYFQSDTFSANYFSANALQSFISSGNAVILNYAPSQGEAHAVVVTQVYNSGASGVLTFACWDPQNQTTVYVSSESAYNMITVSKPSNNSAIQNKIKSTFWSRFHLKG